MTRKLYMMMSLVAMEMAASLFPSRDERLSNLSVGFQMFVVEEGDLEF
jgi:hypothetical protein